MEAILLREFARDTRFISWMACRWPVARVFPLLVILLNLIALSGCIITYEVSPERRQGSGPPHSSQTTQTHVTFQMEPYGSGQVQHSVAADRGHGGVPGIIRHGGAPGIRKVFEESFASATYVLTPRPTGTHVHIEVVEKPFSQPSLLSLLTMISFTVVPHYDDNSYGYVALYNLYQDGKFQSTYRYEITQKLIVWLPLGLFAWVNYFTTGETEAFEETARQFVVDAERDGYVRAPSP